MAFDKLKNIFSRNNSDEIKVPTEDIKEDVEVKGNHDDLEMVEDFEWGAIFDNDQIKPPSEESFKNAQTGLKENTGKIIELDPIANNDEDEISGEPIPELSTDEMNKMLLEMSMSGILSDDGELEKKLRNISKLDDEDDASEYTDFSKQNDEDKIDETITELERVAKDRGIELEKEEDYLGEAEEEETKEIEEPKEKQTEQIKPKPTEKETPNANDAYELESIPEDKLQELNALFGKMEHAIKDGGILQTRDDIDYDAELEKLFAKDSELDSDLQDIEGIDKPEDVVISDDKKVIRIIKFSPREWLDSLSPTKFRLFMGILSGLTIIFLIFAYSNYKKYLFKEYIRSNNAFIVSTNYKNSSKPSYIYTTESYLQNYKGQLLKVEKILLDKRGTAFFMSDKVSLSSNIIKLEDDQGRTYDVDLFLNNFSNREKTVDDNAIVFAPINDDAKMLTLAIYDPSKGETARFSFYFDNDVKLPNAKYVYEETQVFDENGLSLVIDNAEFSSIGSTVTYTLKNEDKNHFLTNGTDEISGIIDMQQKSQSILSIYKNDFGITSDYETIGREEFINPVNLSSNAVVNFNNLYETNVINKTFSAAELYPKDIEPIEVKYQDYTLFLEGARVQGDVIVLVAHTEKKDKTIKIEEPETTEAPQKRLGVRPTPKPIKAKTTINTINMTPIPSQTAPPIDENANRIENKLLVKLIAKDSEGKTVEIEGVTYDGKIGSDIVFTLDDKTDFIRYQDPANVDFQIVSSTIKMDKVSSEINLSKGENDANHMKDINDFVKSAFSNRYSIISGDNTGKYIGFAEDVISDRKLKRFYSSYFDLKIYKYYAQIIAYDDSENETEALVKEVWQTNDGKIESIVNIHKVLIEKNNGNYEIVKDEIVGN